MPTSVMARARARDLAPLRSPRCCGGPRPNLFPPGATSTPRILDDPDRHGTPLEQRLPSLIPSLISFLYAGRAGIGGDPNTLQSARARRPSANTAPPVPVGGRFFLCGEDEMSDGVEEKWNWRELELHELARTFPAMRPEEFERLRGSIASQGVELPITVTEDGHICRRWLPGSCASGVKNPSSAVSSPRQQVRGGLSHVDDR